MTYSYRPNKSTISVIFIILSTLLNYIKAADSFPWPGRGKPVSSTFTPINPTSPAELTVIDVLSSDEQYSDLLRIIQRLKLVPAINKLGDITLYAPTNDAIREAQHAMTDNINDEARETIFYHMLNYTITSQSDQILHQTLLHPDSEHVKPKKPHSPWFPEPGDGKPLSGAGQQVRIGRANSTDICYGLPDLPVGEKYHGNCHENGAATVLSKEPKHARNGVVYPIDKVISPPGDLATQIRNHPSLSTLLELIPAQAISALEQRAANGFTLFLPTNEAFKTLDKTVYSYLHNQIYASSDLLDLMSGHIAVGKGVGWSTTWDTQKEYDTNLKTKLQVNDKNTVKLDSHTSAQINTFDILASNGVIHLIDSFVTPPQLLLLDSEKILIGLNATRFVDLFRSAKLSNKYLKNDQDNMTLLVFHNDVFEGTNDIKEVDALATASDDQNEMAMTLKYHIIPGNIRKDDVKTGELIETELRTRLLGDNGQRVVVSKTKTPSDKSSKTNKSEKHTGWSFNHASVLSDEHKVGNKTIYFISSVLEPPRDVMSVAVSDLRLSTFVASVYAAGMDEYLKHIPATTLVIPTNDAFEELGYAMKYFLKSQAKAELKQLINYHIIDDIVYTKSLSNGTYKTLSDVPLDVNVHNKGNTTEMALGSPRNVAGYPLNGEERKAIISEGDILTSSGVIHVIDQVERSPMVDITLRKLFKGSNANTMLDLFQKAGYQWLLDGKAPPLEDDSNPYEKHNSSTGHPVKPYTVLTPTDAAFTHINLTHYLDDRAALEALVRMHILPAPPDYLDEDYSYALEEDHTTDNGQPLYISDDMAYPSLLSYTEGGPSRYGDVAFKKSQNGWTVGIRGARGVNGPEDFASVLGFGRASPHFYNSTSDFEINRNNDLDNDDPHAMSIGGGIVVLDSVLIPYEPSWIYRWGWIVFTAITGTGVLGAGGYASYVTYQRRKEIRAGYQSLEGEED
ncbi:FAS1 domain-containing protein [Wallemia mellicola]|uniref:FAS1 domain-containing protein n=1 Tax=Wallemia mellicola TaxID=1708541 RepID=A0A4T0PV94_9BASI|nr:hypothetical protein E3Q24_00736 [Wallemia mellicola]TIB90472.1 FAS1 domain-containing protein [Wallemia mellicola]TIB92141.1 FAS1 domain-containing protein [Wallemia mellicola]TIC07306.1 FAS1 domain-containing protein [Wallemia mellicola]TIC13567.1 FAS1 domain-containing protein [Wallemia mellicola]